MNEKQPVPDRVYKIIGDLLERTAEKCTPEEAAQAAEKVQELLAKYNLSLLDVTGRRKDGKKKEFTKSFFDLGTKQKKHDSDWVCCLVNVLAKTNFCTAVEVSVMNKMVILGESHNIEVVEYLTDSLIPRIERACSQAWTMYWGDEKRNTFRRGFLHGCVGGIHAKLIAQAKQMAADNNNYLGLIKVNHTDLMEYTNSVFGKDTLTSEKVGKLRKSQESHVLGYLAGKQMNINKGLQDTDTPSGYID